MKLGEAIYKEQAEAASAEQGETGENKPDEEGVVDAEFTDVTDDDRKAS
jgi:molecular chaperone DnaK